MHAFVSLAQVIEKNITAISTYARPRSMHAVRMPTECLLKQLEMKNKFTIKKSPVSVKATSKRQVPGRQKR